MKGRPIFPGFVLIVVGPGSTILFDKRHSDETRKPVCPQAKEQAKKDERHDRILAGPIRQFNADEQYGGS
jgi:hypothetical protein